MNFYLKTKRIFDFILSLIGIIVLSPFLIAIIICIKVDSKGPVLFKQKRIGKNKTYFYILKFRTMYVNTPNDMPTHLLENPEVYITKVGKILRKTSLDELPQLFNIIKGEMSIVGPRPALWNQDDLISERDKYDANSITPGLTGWAQINGRDELDICEKAKLDGFYRNNICLMLDIKCFLLTLIKVIKKDGIKEGKAR